MLISSEIIDYLQIRGSSLFSFRAKNYVFYHLLDIQFPVSRQPKTITGNRVISFGRFADSEKTLTIIHNSHASRYTLTNS